MPSWGEDPLEFLVQVFRLSFKASSQFLGADDSTNWLPADGMPAK